MTVARVHDVLVPPMRLDRRPELLTLRLTVKVGEHVRSGDLVGETESEKASMDLFAPLSGRVVAVASGEVWPGAVALRIEAHETPEEIADSSVAYVRVGELDTLVDLRALDARVASLGARRAAEASIVAVRVALGLSVAPWVPPSRPLLVAYVSVRAGLEETTDVSVLHQDDELRVRIDEEMRAPDILVVRFHDTVEETAALTGSCRTTVSIGAPRLVATREDAGVVLRPRASLRLLTLHDAASARRALSSLVTALEAP